LAKAGAPSITVLPHPPQGGGYSEIAAQLTLFADQNQNARDQRQNTHDNCSNPNVKERRDSDKNQIDGKQQHSNIFCDHAPFLR